MCRNTHLRIASLETSLFQSKSVHQRSCPRVRTVLSLHTQLYYGLTSLCAQTIFFGITSAFSSLPFLLGAKWKRWELSAPILGVSFPMPLHPVTPGSASWAPFFTLVVAMCNQGIRTIMACFQVYKGTCLFLSPQRIRRNEAQPFLMMDIRNAGKWSKLSVDNLFSVNKHLKSIILIPLPSQNLRGKNMSQLSRQTFLTASVIKEPISVKGDSFNQLCLAVVQDQ